MRRGSNHSIRQTHKIGLDANRPIIVDGPNQGALAPTVADPEVIASTGAAWVRLNFVLGPWSGPNDQTRHQDRTWAETYITIVDRFRERGLNIYALVGHEIMKSSPDFFRVPGREMSSQEVAQAQGWIAEYAGNFLDKGSGNQDSGNQEMRDREIGDQSACPDFLIP